MKKNVLFLLLLFLCPFVVKAYITKETSRVVNTFTIMSKYDVTYRYYYVDENDEKHELKVPVTTSYALGSVIALGDDIDSSIDYNEVKYFINNNEVSGNYTVNGDVTIDEVYYLNRYTITYILNGGSVSGNPTVYTEKTGTITLNNPTKTGYDFSGWTWSGQSNPVENVSFNSTDKENKTFTANYAVQGYNLTTGQAINQNILSTIEHVVFGKTSDYSSEIQGLTGEHVGATSSDLIYMYEKTSTKTIYILSDGVIKFNPASNYMFSNKYKIRDISFANIDTSLVTNLADMFSKCTGLTSLDLSLFNTSRVTDMTSMFGSDTNLTTVYVSSSWNTDAVTESTGMFQSCRKLKGGNGTSYNNGHQDKEYARIDSQSVHGYFTAK